MWYTEQYKITTGKVLQSRKNSEISQGDRYIWNIMNGSQDQHDGSKVL